MSGENDFRALRSRFARNFLDIIILRMLEREPLWGYRIMSILRRDYGLRVGPPVIYPLLNSMEAEGLLDSEEIYIGKRRRRVYHVTQKGLERIRYFKTVLSEILENSGSDT